MEREVIRQQKECWERQSIRSPLELDRVLTALEVAMVLAVGGMLWAAVTRLRRGQVRPLLCPGCSRTVSRVYDACPHCGHPTSG